MLERYFILVRHDFQTGHQIGMIGCAVDDRRAASKPDIAKFALVQSGRVRGVSHVNADGRIWTQAVGNHSRANAAHFFLHGIDKHHVPGDGLFQLAQLAGYFRQDEAAQPVVQSPAYQLVFIHQHGAVAVNANVAHSQTEFRYFLVRGGAYVYVNFPDFGFLFSGFPQVDGRVSGHPHHFALGTKEAHAAPPRDGRIRTAHAFHIQEAVLGDMADHEADFIRMGFNHQCGSFFRVRVEDGPGISVGVALDIFRIFAQFVRPDALGVYFKAGRAWGFQKFR